MRKGTAPILVGVPNTRSLFRPLTEIDPYFPQPNRTLSGTSRDSIGAALANCTAILFDASNWPSLTQWATTTTDANGNYSFVVDPPRTWLVLFYKSGPPDVVGATVNSLVGV